MRDSLFGIITFIELTASQEEKAELALRGEKAFPTIWTYVVWKF
jgi:hypothetical protein